MTGQRLQPDMCAFRQFFNRNDLRGKHRIRSGQVVDTGIRAADDITCLLHLLQQFVRLLLPYDRQGDVRGGNLVDPFPGQRLIQTAIGHRFVVGVDIQVIAGRFVLEQVMPSEDLPDGLLNGLAACLADDQQIHLQRFAAQVIFS